MSAGSSEFPGELRRDTLHPSGWQLGEMLQRILVGPPAAPSFVPFPRLGIIGAVILAVFLFVALFPQVLAPYDPNALIGTPMGKPSLRFWLGTNDLGQDLLSELIWSSRLSLAIGLSSSTLAVSFGLIVGCLAGYIGGWLEQVLMRFVDLVIVIPVLPIMILLAAYLGPSPWNVMAVIAFVSWAGPARVIRSQILGLRNELYVEAARSVGAGELRILWRHLLPGVANMTISQFALVASNAILAEASLSFLGLGDPTAKSWGSMLYFAQARGAFLTGAWLWWVLPPGLLIMFAILGLVLVSYALEERFEPGLRY